MWATRWPQSGGDVTDPLGRGGAGRGPSVFCSGAGGGWRVWRVPQGRGGGEKPERPAWGLRDEGTEGAGAQAHSGGGWPSAAEHGSELPADAACTAGPGRRQAPGATAPGRAGHVAVGTASAGDRPSPGKAQPGSWGNAPGARRGEGVPSPREVRAATAAGRATGRRAAAVAESGRSLGSAPQPGGRGLGGAADVSVDHAVSCCALIEILERNLRTVSGSNAFWIDPLVADLSGFLS